MNERSREILCSDEKGCELSAPACALGGLNSLKVDNSVEAKIKDQIQKKVVIRDVARINQLFLLAHSGDREAFSLFLSPEFTKFLDEGGGPDNWVQSYRKLLEQAKTVGCLNFR